MFLNRNFAVPMCRLLTRRCCGRWCSAITAWWVQLGYPRILNLFSQTCADASRPLPPQLSHRLVLLLKPDATRDEYGREVSSADTETIGWNPETFPVLLTFFFRRISAGRHRGFEFECGCDYAREALLRTPRRPRAPKLSTSVSFLLCCPLGVLYCAVHLLPFPVLFV